jgi:O-antigen/teichoic acid export membrane protein
MGGSTDKETAGLPAQVDVKQAPSLIRNVVSNWAGLAAAVIYSLVITPVVVRALDREAYGIWSFLNGLVAYSSLFYLGLGAALVKYVSQYYAVGDRAALNRLVSVVLTVYVGLGVATLTAGLLVAPSVPRMLLTGEAVTPAATVSLTVVVLAARVALMFVGSVFSGILVAQGRTDRYRSVTVAGHLGRLLIVPIAVQAPDPLLALALVVGLTGAVEVSAMGLIAAHQDRDLRYRIVIPIGSELRILYRFGFLAFLLQVGNQLISYTDTTVIGLILGPKDVALYVLPLQLAEYGRIVVFGIVSVMLPHLSALLATGRLASFQFLHQRTLKTTALVAVFVNSSILWLGQGFLRVWVGPTFSEHALPVLVALAIASVAQAVAVQSQTPFCLALGRVRFAAIVLVVEGMANLALSIVLAPRFGISGVAAATAITAVLMSGAILPVHVARQVGTPVWALMRTVAGPIAIFTVAVTAGHLGLSLAMPGASYLTLAAKLAIAAVIALAVGWRVVTDSERRVVKTIVARSHRSVLAAFRRSRI